MKTEFTVAEAAEFLGITPQGVRDAIRRGALTASGNPRQVSRADLLALMEERDREARSRHPDLRAYAKELVGRFNPPPVDPVMTELASGETNTAYVEHMFRLRSEALRLRQNPGDWSLTDARAIFGKAVIETLAKRDVITKAGGCAWCFADGLAAAHDLPRPQNTESMQVLLGKPCIKDRDRWASRRRKAAVSASAALPPTGGGAALPPRGGGVPVPQVSPERAEFNAASASLNRARGALHYATTPHDKRIRNEQYTAAVRRFETARAALRRNA